jgi:hypothetical protein
LNPDCPIQQWLTYVYEPYYIQHYISLYTHRASSH